MPMEGSGPFNARLEEAVAQRRAWLEAKQLPRLKESVQTFHTLYESLINMLLKKGMLREDPYRYDQQITEISVPPDEMFLEAEKEDEMSYRLAAFQAQVDFLLNYYQFSTEFLDLGRLKKLSALFKYIAWLNLSDVSKNITTRCLSEFLTKIRKGADPMAAGIINDSLSQIEKCIRGVGTAVAQTVAYHREAWKLEFRLKVLGTAGIDGAMARSRPDDAVKAVKRPFSQSMPGRPFYPELAKEVLDEEYGERGSELREALLASLAVADERKDKAPRKPQVDKAALLEAVRLLGRADAPLVEALQTVMENKEAVMSRALSLGERLRLWILSSLGRKEEDNVYEIEYFERNDPAPRSEKVAFEPFTASVRKKAALLSSVSGKGGSMYLRLEAAGDGEIIDFLDKNMAEVERLRRRLEGLNVFFQGEAPREQRARIRSVKVPLESVKSCLVKANQKKHEYVAHKEEEEQMRRLGIG